MIIASHRSPLEKVQQRYGPAHILDVTSHGPEPWRRFSPFYPHGGIPVPFSPGQVSASVEGIWQGLKVFQSMDVDTSTFAITKMKGIKRSARKYPRDAQRAEGALSCALETEGHAELEEVTL